MRRKRVIVESPSITIDEVQITVCNKCAALIVAEHYGDHLREAHGIRAKVTRLGGLRAV